MPTETQVEAKILSLISELIPGKNKSRKLTEDTHLQRELGVNSIGLLSLMFRFEEEFHVDLSQIDFGAQLAQLRTVGDLIKVGKQLLEITE